MERIAAFREAGLALGAIRGLLDGAQGAPSKILNARLAQINLEIQGLRKQQQVLVRLLQSRRALRKSRVMTKERWVKLLSAAGMDEAGMGRWHSEFESSAPEAHQDFLESLGIGKEEIASIRKWSRG
jgi:DNA-binding transcriptional MerR regulator